jgi:site-specific recombinase XerD
MKLQEWYLQAGLTKTGKFHNWRHKYARNLIEQGEDIYVVSKMLNHKDVRTTQIYTDVSPNKKAIAAKKANVKKNEKEEV